MKKDWKQRKTVGIAAGTLATAFLVTSIGTPVSALTVDEAFAEGTYTSTAEGYGGPVSVTVTLGTEHTITGIDAEGTKETPTYWEKARKVLRSIAKSTREGRGL